MGRAIAAKSDRSVSLDEERYALVLRAVTEGIYDWNIEANALWVSPRLIEIFGFPGTELSAADWNARVHPEDFAIYRAALADCFRGKTQRLRCEYRIGLDSGIWRWVEDQGVPVRNSQGRAVRLIGGVSDVTERKQTEQALRDSEERHALALQAVNESIYEWNIDTGEMYYSPRLYEALGVAPAELRTRNDWVDRIHPDDLPSYRRALVAHFKGESDRFESEYRFRHSDGTWRWARQHGVALRDARGRAFRMAGSTGDITVEKELRENLERAQRQLTVQQKMASLGQLTAGIAHEIKNPLNFVNNFAGLANELLAELKDIAAPAIEALEPPRRAEFDETMEMLRGNLDKIEQHGRRADNIVKSMLAHSRGSSGDWQTVDLNALVDEALTLAYHGARAQDQSFNIALERDFDVALRPIELVPQDLTRVFLNLIGNGLYAANGRFKEGGDPAYRPVLRVATRDSGDEVEIKVRDNGAGIPPELRDKLFTPFFTTKPTGEGTGLGLSISYDIVVQQHGGTITVDSRVDEFTEFTIRLPRAGTATRASA